MAGRARRAGRPGRARGRPPSRRTAPSSTRTNGRITGPSRSSSAGPTPADQPVSPVASTVSDSADRVDDREAGHARRRARRTAATGAPSRTAVADGDRQHAGARRRRGVLTGAETEQPDAARDPAPRRPRRAAPPTSAREVRRRVGGEGIERGLVEHGRGAGRQTEPAPDRRRPARRSRSGSASPDRAASGSARVGSTCGHAGREQRAEAGGVREDLDVRTGRRAQQQPDAGAVDEQVRGAAVLRRRRTARAVRYADEDLDRRARRTGAGSVSPTRDAGGERRPAGRTGEPAWWRRPRARGVGPLDAATPSPVTPSTIGQTDRAAYRPGRRTASAPRAGRSILFDVEAAAGDHRQDAGRRNQPPGSSNRPTGAATARLPLPSAAFSMPSASVRSSSTWPSSVVEPRRPSSRSRSASAGMAASGQPAQPVDVRVREERDGRRPRRADQLACGTGPSPTDEGERVGGRVAEADRERRVTGARRTEAPAAPGQQALVRGRREADRPGGEVGVGGERPDDQMQGVAGRP